MGAKDTAADVGEEFPGGRPLSGAVPTQTEWSLS
jgi:hypothetical protein